MVSTATIAEYRRLRKAIRAAVTAEDWPQVAYLATLLDELAQEMTR